MKIKIFFNCLLCIFLFLLSGCIRFSNPIIGYSDAVFDSSLVGLWQENTDESEFDYFVLILRETETPKYKAVVFDGTNYSFDEKDGLYKADLIYTGTFDDEKYVVLYFSTDNSYLFWKYEVENETLHVFTMDISAFENAIKEKQIKGEISGKGLNEEISVNADLEALQCFIRENKQVFDTSSFMEFKKVDIR